MIDDLKTFYRDFGKADLNALADLYAEAAVFKDPLHTLTGLTQIEHYFASGRQGLISCEFDYLNEFNSEDSALLEWNMRFAHRRLKRGQPIVVSGCSVFTFSSESSKVIRHVDYYDMGELVYEQIPVLGSVVRSIKKGVMAP